MRMTKSGVFSGNVKRRIYSLSVYRKAKTIGPPPVTAGHVTEINPTLLFIGEHLELPL
jgi:hypothetical protein